jgi:regulator of protease activity HflC (stomatin/prohibitin superfamily)
LAVVSESLSGGVMEALLVVLLLGIMAFVAYRVAGSVLSMPGGLARRVSVFEWERGLIYRGGRFDREVAAGSYWLGPLQSIVQMPVLARTVDISAQEMLTADRLQVKLTAVVVYRVIDARKAMETSGIAKSNDFRIEPPPAQEALYREAQLALRSIASSRSLELLLDAREAISEELRLHLQVTAEQHGLVIESAAVRDIILGSEMRRLYAEGERARLEGLAALERARGEQAALRSLANAARMLKNNPELMNLRLLQTVDTRSGKSNTIALKRSEADNTEAGDNGPDGLMPGFEEHPQSLPGD